MVEPVTAIYLQDGDDWEVTVVGHGQRLTARAPGIIAARDSADQLVEKMAEEAGRITVVHLLNGSALEFTTVYMTARLSRAQVAWPELPASTLAPAAPGQTKRIPDLTNRKLADVADALSSAPKASVTPAIRVNTTVRESAPAAS